MLAVSSPRQRDGLITYFFECSPSVQRLRAQARRLTRRPPAPPRWYGLASTIMHLAALAHTLRTQLKGELDHVRSASVRDLAGINGETTPDVLPIITRVREGLDALVAELRSAYATATQIQTAFAERLGPAESRRV